MDKNVGMRFGKLTVLESDSSCTDVRHKRYFCKCDCGNIKSIRISSLKSGTTVSCGCYRKVVAGKYEHKNGKHYMRNTKIYGIWSSMKQRCSPNYKKSHRYYERGIRVCNEWQNFDSFFDYVSKLEHFGEEGYTLDRIDNNKGYEPNNVRWATMQEQAINKENTIIVKYMGKEQPLIKWCEELGLNYDTIRARHLKGWTVPMLFSEKHKNQFG